MRNTIIIALLVFSAHAYSQTTIDSVLSAIERNNTTLSAFHEKVEAAKIENRTGIFLSDPEVGFHYLWGDPAEMGTRTDISISQSFDFPTAYVYRNQISSMKNEQADLEYRKQRMDILWQARLLCVEITYQNALMAEYSKRLSHARQIADSYKKKLEKGAITILAYNKARVHLLNLEKDHETTGIERNALLDRLERLNGGEAITFNDSVYTEIQLVPDFEQWYARIEQNNPILKWVKQELVIAQKQQKLQISENLPQFSAGFMSEKVAGEQFRGITFGVSIPLWENKNKMKHVKAKAVAAEHLQTDVKLQFYNEMKGLHAQVLALQKSVAGYRNELVEFDHRSLLEKALEKGEFTLGEYFIELSLFYGSVDKMLGMKRDMNKAYAELLKYH